MDWLKDKACVACEVSYKALGSHFVPSNSFGSVIDPAHTVNNGRGSKGPDSSCIPLCKIHHNEMDGRLSTKITTKQAFAEKYGLDLAAIAAEHYERYEKEQYGKQESK